jgi:hypothetical protein
METQNGINLSSRNMKVYDTILRYGMMISNKNRAPVISTLDLKLRKKLVKCYSLSIA